MSSISENSCTNLFLCEFRKRQHFLFFPGLGQGVPAANGKSGMTGVESEGAVKDEYNTRVK